MLDARSFQSYPYDQLFRTSVSDGYVSILNVQDCSEDVNAKDTHKSDQIVGGRRADGSSTDGRSL